MVRLMVQAYENDLLYRLLRPRHGVTRCINGENPQGGKGEAGNSSSPLGFTRKGHPSLPVLRRGETVTIADIQEPGIIKHMWFTVTDATSPQGLYVLRNLLIKIYWDGEERPSVVSPLGDFFCCGHGRGALVDSLPICVNPTRGFNCYFPMPFSSARIVLVNNHDEDVQSVFYQIDYELNDALPDELMRFHAQWRREPVTTRQQDYTLLDGVAGDGIYVGTYLALTALQSRWWGEGEFKFFIDGDNQFPTWCSTGAEDYFGGAWSFRSETNKDAMHEQTYNRAFMGYPFYSRTSGGEASDYWDDSGPVVRGMYRWHLMDPIIFHQDLRVTWQQIGGRESGMFEREDDVATVAYWYQTEPHLPFPTVVEKPDPNLLMPR